MFVISLMSLVAALTAGQQPAGGTETITTRSTAAAQSPGGSTPPTTPGGGPAMPGDRMICTSVQVTGTRFPVRRCRTAAQLEAERTESREQLRQVQASRMPSTGN